MSRPENGAPDGNANHAVTADAPGPIAQDTHNAEEFGKELGEQQRRATGLEEQSKGDGKDKEQVEAAAEGKKKRWGLNWPWSKGKKVRTSEGDVIDIY